MVLDTSAIVAILLDEPEREEFLAKIYGASQCFLSASTMLEAVIVMRRESKERGVTELLEFLTLLEVEVVPFDDEQAAIAAEADREYGKGLQKRAKLNLGDCFAYALAKKLSEPLLFKGNDFIWTDVLRA